MRKLYGNSVRAHSGFKEAIKDILHFESQITLKRAEHFVKNELKTISQQKLMMAEQFVAGKFEELKGTKDSLVKEIEKKRGIPCAIL